MFGIKLHKYSKAIMAAYGIFSLGLLLTCLLIVQEVNKLIGATEQLYTHPFSVSNAALDAEATLSRIRDRVIFAVLSRDGSNVRDAIREIDTLDGRFFDSVVVLNANYLGDRDDIDKAVQLYSGWRSISNRILQLAKDNDFDEARELTLTMSAPAYEGISARLQNITEISREKASEYIVEARAQSVRAERIVYLTILLGFAASFLSGLYVVRHVERIVRRNEDLLLHKAYHDPLTGLPNRPLLLDRLAQAIQMAQRQDTLVAVLFVDLDGFKGVNDTLGHDAGDSLLVEVAERLASALRRSDTVARLGGDEFVVVLPGFRTREEVSHVAEKVAATLNRPAVIKQDKVPVRASMGVAVYPYDGSDAAALMISADAAMYQAKLSGPVVFFSAGEASQQRM